MNSENKYSFCFPAFRAFYNLLAFGWYCGCKEVVSAKKEQRKSIGTVLVPGSYVASCIAVSFEDYSSPSFAFLAFSAFTIFSAASLISWSFRSASD